MGGTQEQRLLLLQGAVFGSLLVPGAMRPTVLAFAVLLSTMFDTSNEDLILHCPKKYLNLSIKTEADTAGAYAASVVNPNSFCLNLLPDPDFGSLWIRIRLSISKKWYE